MENTYGNFRTGMHIPTDHLGTPVLLHHIAYRTALVDL